ncbi:unnamed protein product, partial [Tilletia caries]
TQQQQHSNSNTKQQQQQNVHAASSSLRQDRSSPPSRPALELSLFRSSGQSSVLAMFSGHNTL